MQNTGTELWGGNGQNRTFHTRTDEVQYPYHISREIFTDQNNSSCNRLSWYLWVPWINLWSSLGSNKIYLDNRMPGFCATTNTSTIVSSPSVVISINCSMHSIWIPACRLLFPHSCVIVCFAFTIMHTLRVIMLMHLIWVSCSSQFLQSSLYVMAFL